jgi:LysR family transcriptional regulator, low CO2-responsive transcriptional regulator
MNITFRQLKTFLALADTGSVSAAAQLMHVTQPTASMQLREVTQAVGAPLYEIVAKKIYLTDLGQELAMTARSISQSWDSFQQGLDAAHGLKRGKLKVAVVSTAKYFMPRLIGSFCKKYPEIDIAIEILNRDGVVQRLRQNLDDLYIMSKPPADIDLHDEIFMSNPLVLIAAASDPLTKRTAIALTEFQAQRFILREKGSGTRMATDQYFKSQRFRPDVRLELGSNEAIKEAVAGKLGIGLISRHALHGRQKEHGVSVLDAQGFPIASSWHLVYPKGKKLSPLAQSFKTELLGKVRIMNQTDRPH